MLLLSVELAELLKIPLRSELGNVRGIHAHGPGRPFTLLCHGGLGRSSGGGRDYLRDGGDEKDLVDEPG